MILQCIFVQHQRKTSIFKILLAPDHPPPPPPADCGAARLSDRLWFGKPSQQVVVQHFSPAGCGSASLPGRLSHSMPPGRLCHGMPPGRLWRGMILLDNPIGF